MRKIVRDEMEQEQKSRDQDEFTAWEKRHPFQAMICQGDRSCTR